MARISNKDTAKAVLSLQLISARFNRKVGQPLTDEDNVCVQGLVERLKLLTIAFAHCSSGALANVTKKYNKAKDAQGGLKYKRVIPK